MEIRRLPIWAFSAAAVLLVWAWQWTTVTANYGGNWTALFCTGASQPQPPGLASEHIYRFPGSAGYDGQNYHYMAHDPLLRTSIAAAVDDPRFRYRRILVPALAFAAALGQSAWVDTAYEGVCLLAIALGVWWSCRYTQNAGLSPAWGLLFLSFPAIPITADRLVVDAALAALTAAFLYSGPAPSWKVFLVLCCAALARETGLLLIAGYCAWLLLRRHWPALCIFPLSAAPALAWFAYVHARTAPEAQPVTLAPLWSLIDAFRHPLGYPTGTPLAAWISFADGLALAGLAIAFVAALVRLLRRPADPVRITAAVFVLMGVLVRDPNPFHNVYDFGRVYTPLLLCLAAGAMEARPVVLLLPAALMLPRIAMQFAPQLLGIGHWLGLLR